MAFREWEAVPTLNRARVLADRAIARYAPVWLPGELLQPYVINADNVITPANQPEPIALSGEDALLATAKAAPEPDYLRDLTESEKAMVRHVSDGDEGRAKYAKDLKDWRESHR
jgi:hypothetical protein